MPDVSLSAETPEGSWLKLELEARGSGRQTKAYILGIWAAGDADVRRTSVAAQDDADGLIEVDTFIREATAAPLDGYRLRVTLCRRAGSSASPVVRGLAAVVSARAAYSTSSPPGEPWLGSGGR